MKRYAPKNVLRDRRGFLTVDFLFAITLAAAMIMIMFAFTTTLTVFEVAQYIAFSTSRAHSAAHKSQDKQITLGEQKFDSFSDPQRFPALAPLLKNGWFEIEAKSLEIRGGGAGNYGTSDKNFNEIYGYHENSMPETGIRFKLHAKILKLNLPLLGRVTNDEDFSTYVTGLLIREPTTEECMGQMGAEQRFKELKRQDSRFNGLWSNQKPQPVPSNTNAYFPMEDQGC